MNFFRTRRAPIAWMLYAFILFNGLACAIGHGQMMGRFSAPAAAPESQHQHHGSAAMMSGHTMEMSTANAADHSRMAMPGSLQSLFGDCSFAGTLTLAMIFFVALGWLIRSRTPRFVFPSVWPGHAFRHSFPGVNPQAP